MQGLPTTKKPAKESAVRLNDFTLQPAGEMTRNTDLKNLEKGHQFMPMRGKQVSARQLIIPTVYRSYICFAKLEYN